MSLEEELEDYRHMWNGSEDWVLFRIEHRQITLTILFQALRPSAQEMVVIRRLLPRYGNMLASQARSEFGSVGKLELKPLSVQHATEVTKRGEQLGLKIETTQSSLVSCLPVRRPGSTASIIENDALAQMVVARMLAAGVPVIPYTY